MYKIGYGEDETITDDVGVYFAWRAAEFDGDVLIPHRTRSKMYYIIDRITDIPYIILDRIVIRFWITYYTIIKIKRLFAKK